MSNVDRTSNPVSLPTWEECKAKVDAEMATPLEAFIYENEPALTEKAQDFVHKCIPNYSRRADEQFRGMLAALIAFVRAPDETSATCWVSVSDQLPELGKLVMICIGGFISIGQRFERNRWADLAGEFYARSITHWMPIPAGPGSSVEPTPPHPGPSIAKAFANSPRRVDVKASGEPVSLPEESGCRCGCYSGGCGRPDGCRCGRECPCYISGRGA